MEEDRADKPNEFLTCPNLAHQCRYGQRRAIFKSTIEALEQDVKYVQS